MKTLWASCLKNIMPVRIYDLAKKLGIESKEVLAKAKALGMSAAKVPSSSLDKITAQFLKDELLKDHPQANAAAEPLLRRQRLPLRRRRFRLFPSPLLRLSPFNLRLKQRPRQPNRNRQLSRRRQRRKRCPLRRQRSFSSRRPNRRNRRLRPRHRRSRCLRLHRRSERRSVLSSCQQNRLRAPRPTNQPRAARHPAERIFSDEGDLRGVRGAPQPASAPQLPGQRFPQRPPQRPGAPAAPKPAEKFVPPANGQIITLKPPIIVRDLAEQLKRKPFQIIADLMEPGRIRQRQPVH